MFIWSCSHLRCSLHMALLAAYKDNQLRDPVLWVAGSGLLTHMVFARLCLLPECGPGWAVDVPTQRSQPQAGPSF